MTDRININRSLYLQIFPAVWLTAALLLGCATGYGNMVRDPAVANAFKTNRALENHTYYYRNWLGEPIAVVGIRKGYTLDSDLWFEIDLNEVPLQLLWDRMARRDPTNFEGSRLRDPAGNDMGVWFSDYDGATIKMKSDTVIAFITPYGMPRYGDDDGVRPTP